MDSLVATLTQDLFQQAILISDDTQVKDVSVQREMIKLKYLLNALPAETGRTVMQAVIPAMDNIIQSNEACIAFALKLSSTPQRSGKYWQNVHTRREKVAAAYLKPLAHEIEGLMGLQAGTSRRR